MKCECFGVFQLVGANTRIQGIKKPNKSKSNTMCIHVFNTITERSNENCLSNCHHNLHELGRMSIHVKSLRLCLGVMRERDQRGRRGEEGEGEMKVSRKKSQFGGTMKVG